MVSKVSVGVLALCAALYSAGSPAHAAPDCGDPPMNAPTVPEGSKSNRDEMTKAVAAVKAYSAEVDAYLNCKDERAATVFQWMNEDQRARWEQDLNELHLGRVELQRGMNEAIRDFNAVTEGAGS